MKYVSSLRMATVFVLDSSRFVKAANCGLNLNLARSGWFTEKP